MSLSGPYTLTNRKTQFVLFLSQDDNKSAIAEDGGPPDNQTWIIQPVGEGTVQIISQANGLFLGFIGFPMPGVPLIVGDESVAKTWNVISDDPDYKFRLAGTSFVIQFPSNNVQPGSSAELGMMLPQASNQDWNLTRPLESFSQ